MADRSPFRILGIVVAALLVLGVGTVLYLRSLLAPEALAATLNDAIGPATNGLYSVAIGDSSFLLVLGDLRLEDVELRINEERLRELTAGADHPPVRFRVRIDALVVDGFSLRRLALERAFVADSVMVEQPEVTAIFDPIPLTDVLAPAPEPAGEADDAAVASVLPPAEKLRQALRGVPTIALDRVALTNGGLRLETLEHVGDGSAAAEQVAASDVIGNIDIELLGVRIDEDASIEDVRGLYTDDIRLRVSDVETRQLGGNTLHLGELTASSKEEKVTLAGFGYAPTATIAEYLSRPTVPEGDRVNVLVDSLAIDGLAFSRYMAAGEIFVRGITVDGFRVDVLSDKHKPSRPRQGRAPMPHDFFQSLDTTLTVEEVVLRNGQVTYSERAADGNTPGTVTFGELNARIANVSNDPARMSADTPLVLEATTRANDAASVSVQWRIPVLSPAPTMTTKAQIAAFDPRVLNPTLEPLLGVRVNSGHIDSIAYEIDYGPAGMQGEVDAYYSDLKVQLLDKNTRKRGLGKKILGFVANAIAIRGSNPGRPGQAPHRGVVNEPIEPGDAFFKLIWVGLRDGMAEVAARIG